MNFSPFDKPAAMKCAMFVLTGIFFILSVFCYGQQVCDQYPQIADNFSLDKDYYHGYRVESYICNADKGVTIDLVYSIFISNTSFVAPTFKKDPVVSCGRVVCNLMALGADMKYSPNDNPANDPIVTVIDKLKYNVTNFTLPEHRLHAGKVVRTVVKRGNELYLVTVGTGNNSNLITHKINSDPELMNLLWHRVDAAFIAEVKKRIGAGIPMVTVTPLKKIFKIDASYVTLPTNKTFKWYDWDKAPDDLKIAAGYISMYTNKNTGETSILLDYIQQRVKNDCSVKIAAIDLDNDGICGIAVETEGQYCCGTAGCGIEVYENGGLKTVNVDITRDEMLPAKSGIMLEHHLVPLVANTHVQIDAKKVTELFTYDVAKVKSVKAGVISSLVGGTTPEELGKVLLKALKTNDKNLWMRCFHPELETMRNSMYIQAMTENFDKVRTGFNRFGLTNWELAQFSRVTYNSYDDGLHAVSFKLEFTYKNGEFVGGVAIPSTLKYNGKYFLITPVEDYGMVRNVRR